MQAAARRWGLGTGSSVVVYDDWNRAGSSRAWWVLKAAGLNDVRILHGGLAAWRSAGGELQTGVVTPAEGDVTLGYDDLYAGALPTLTADDAAALAGRLLDARAPERFVARSSPSTRWPVTSPAPPTCRAPRCSTEPAPSSPTPSWPMR